MDFNVLKFTVFSLLIAAVWLVFSVPIIIYHLPQREVLSSLLIYIGMSIMFGYPFHIV